MTNGRLTTRRRTTRRITYQTSVPSQPLAAGCTTDDQHGSDCASRDRHAHAGSDIVYGIYLLVVTVHATVVRVIQTTGVAAMWFVGATIERVLLVQMFDPSAKTFRSGRIGGWKEAFDNRHKLVFKAVAGELLIRLGYEKDFDW